MNYDYDVVIVGARVAGSATAMLLARCGHRVLAVERAPMPSDALSTHAVMRTGVLQLSRWGVLDPLLERGTPPVTEITLGFGDERVPFRVKTEFGIDSFLGPRRLVLDDVLIAAAREDGAEIRDRTRVVGLIRHGDRVGGVEIEDDTGRSVITARVVIGADGYRSRVAESVGAGLVRAHPPLNAVHYAYFTGVDHPGFWFQFTPGVNAGLVRTNDEQTLVFVGRPTELAARFQVSADQEFSRLLAQAGADLADLVQAGTRVSPYRGTPGLPGFMRRAWGPGWALVGDASHTKDPISAHGISDALRDAEICARAVDRGLLDPDGESVAMTWYESLRDSLAEEIYKESEALASYEWSPEEASARMRVMSDEIRSECETLLALPDWRAVRDRSLSDV